jgi:hypothetical protein
VLRNHIPGKNCFWLTCPRKLFLLGILSRGILSPDFHPRRIYLGQLSSQETNGPCEFILGPVVSSAEVSRKPLSVSTAANQKERPLIAFDSK